jgi:hypothetical protein
MNYRKVIDLQNVSVYNESYRNSKEKIDDTKEGEKEALHVNSHI